MFTFPSLLNVKVEVAHQKLTHRGEAKPVRFQDKYQNSKDSQAKKVESPKCLQRSQTKVLEISTMPKLSLFMKSLLYQFCPYVWLHTGLPPGLFPLLVPGPFSASVFSCFTQLPQLYTIIFQNWNSKFPICTGSLCDIYVLLKHQWIGLHSLGCLPCFDNLIKEITQFEYSMGDADLLLLSHHLAVPVQVMYLQKESYSKIRQN